MHLHPNADAKMVNFPGRREIWQVSKLNPPTTSESDREMTVLPRELSGREDVRTSRDNPQISVTSIPNDLRLLSLRSEDVLAVEWLSRLS
jgi:hypothetical protein